ncbi:armadillo repeat-containing protein 5 [Elysia marginata]|uniref:Armadillo repeat-containing protein 5 n=1 Tax=Elysia marginata TaxID=1093978 RepID=A0AAV4GC94_9GAST|nr:armadillo repeat-containing protein 5 [Elysia marginata]
MGLEEEIARVISELQTGVDRSLFGSLTVLRTRLIKSAQARAQLLQRNAAKLLLDLLGEKARHGQQKKLPDLVVSILANLCLDDVASEQILHHGGLETIATFTLAADHESIQNRGVRALYNLAKHDGVIEELFNLEVPEFVTTRLLETEDEECRITYCRAIRQIGKTDSAVRRLVEDTVAVQALASMLKLDNKTLALKGLRTLAELGAIRCCTQFAGQVLTSKVEEELVNFSEDEDSDMAYFSLSLVYRLCEQGLVRPSLGAAGVVKLLVRLMSSTRRHVNRVSVLNSLCLCSMDSVNRNRMLEAGALEIFVGVLNGVENAQALSIGSATEGPSRAEGKDRVTSIEMDESEFHSNTEDKTNVLKKSQFHVLYDRIIGCLVNFIYHDKCFTKLVDLGIVDVLLVHLQRCSNYQTDNHADMKSESGIMTRKICDLTGNLDEQLKNEKLSTTNFSANKCVSSEVYGADMSGFLTDSTHNLEFMASGSSENTAGGYYNRRIRHESKGFELAVNSEAGEDTGIIQVEDTDPSIVHEAKSMEEEEEEQISQNIYSRDPLNIDNEEIGCQIVSQEKKTLPEMNESAAGSSNEECGASSLSFRKVKHTFSINSPTYQSEISRRSEDPHSSGMTCKNFSNSGSHTLAQGTSPGGTLNPSWPTSPASAMSSQLSSPRGFQSPYSPLSADASYYSPTQSSPPYSGAPFSPPSSLPPHSPPSSSQPGLSPALSWVSSSLASPGERSLTSASPLPFHSPQAGVSQGNFSPLRLTNFPGSPLLTSDTNSQGQEVVSSITGSGVSFQTSPGLFSDTNSQGDGAIACSGHSQSLPGPSFETETLTQGTLTISSPIYSATDDEDDDQEEEDNKDENKTFTGRVSFGEDLPALAPRSSVFIIEDEMPCSSEAKGVACETVFDCKDLNVKAIPTPAVSVDAASTSISHTTLNRSNKRSSSTEYDPVDMRQGRSLDGDDLSPKRCRVEFNPSVADSTLSVSASASPKTLSCSTQPLQDGMMKVSSRDKKLVPRSTNVSKKFQRMLSAPCPETNTQNQIGFKKRSSLLQLQVGAKDVSKTEGSGTSPNVFNCSTNSETTSFSSPSSACSPVSSQKGTEVKNSSRLGKEKTLFSTFQQSRHPEKRGRASDEKFRKIMQTTESNIFILLSSCSVRQSSLLKLIKTNVLINLLSYIRSAPAPLQRCFRTLKRLFSNQIIFNRLILAHTSTLIIKSLILEDDGTFPKTMFCAEWEDLFGELRRSRMNLSDLLPCNKTSDDSGTNGSQASDFGQRLDFEFHGDAYNMARTMSSSSSLAHRMFRDLYHNIRSFSSDSQNAWDTDSASHPSEFIYQPGVPRVETRVRVGLKLLACLSTIATSSYGEGEIQHLAHRGKPSEQLSCRIFMLHTPVVW